MKPLIFAFVRKLRTSKNSAKYIGSPLIDLEKTLFGGTEKKFFPELCLVERIEKSFTQSYDWWKKLS